ncbi:hypothetical protein [Cellulosimicrobium arenosum]|uniref:Uncharacterized protein n=1 Tax=Cellulosimicrobium arenosum TaxID=2708133 RepID=A0A927J130_9MICO|nr:hypothetical protein [Cellulosimicrobium arenosum]MBD8079931.1 hypothetical protein [Cellulosimicrobium arenosum]
MTSIRAARSPLAPRAGRTRARTVGAVAAVLLLAAACTGGDEDEIEPVTVGADEYQPVVEMTVPVPRSPEDEVTVGVVALTADGPTTQLQVVLTPHFTSVEPGDLVSIYDMFGNDVLPTIVDVDAVTSYEVVSDTGTDLETDVNRASARNDEAVLYQAWFPRPQGDPAAVDLWLHPSWPAIEDFPVTYEPED